MFRSKFLRSFQCFSLFLIKAAYQSIESGGKGQGSSKAQRINNMNMTSQKLRLIVNVRRNYGNVEILFTKSNEDSLTGHLKKTFEASLNFNQFFVLNPNERFLFQLKINFLANRRAQRYQLISFRSGVESNSYFSFLASRLVLFPNV